MKDHIQDQAELILEAFKICPATMLMVAKKTGIERANICRHIAAFRGGNRVATFAVGKCKITRYKAQYLTTDEKLFPRRAQLLLWD